MVRAWTLPVLGVALLLAIVVGVNLGNAAIDGINPIHFQPRQEPRQRPIAVETSPIGLSHRQPTYAELYGWEEGNRALAAECPGCDGRGGTYSAAIPYFGSREELAAAERRAQRVIDAVYAEEEADAAPRKVSPARAPESAAQAFAPPVVEVAAPPAPVDVDPQE